MKFEEDRTMSKMMEYKGYHAQIEYDGEDEIFVGKVYGIVDSLNFHGTSVSELEEMFHQSIDNYLQMCARTGKTPDKEFKGSFNIRISPELHRGISLQAAQEGISLNQYVLKALENSLCIGGNHQNDFHQKNDLS
jgi:predicted HicB family RNase H-like nuclease